MSCSKLLLRTPQMRQEPLHPGRRLRFGTPLRTLPGFDEELACRSTIPPRDIPPYLQHPHLISKVRDRYAIGLIVPCATALVFVQHALDLQRIVSVPHFSTNSAAIPSTLDERGNVVHNQAE